ncbi:uncharacterized protein LOC144473908 isoform X2 [Augochlora pura]
MKMKKLEGINKTRKNGKISGNTRTREVSEIGETGKSNETNKARETSKTRENMEARETSKTRENMEARETSKTEESMNVGETSKTTEIDESSEFPLTEGADSHRESSSVQQKGDNETSPSTKKMRQTTITEFWSGNIRITEATSPQQVNTPKKTLKKAIAKQNQTLIQGTDFYVQTPKRSTPIELKRISESRGPEEDIHKKVVTRRSGMITEKVDLGLESGTKITSINNEISTPKDNTTKPNQPFVQIHIDSDTMEGLLSNNVKVEVEDESSEFALQNYSLRRVTRNAIDQASNDLNTTPTNKSIKRIRSRTLSPRMVREKRKHKWTEDELRTKFKCKGCKINLVRCDMVVETKTVDVIQISIREDEELAEMWRKNMKLTRSNVPLTKVDEPITVECLQESEMSNASCDSTKTSSRILFRCKVCKERFPLKKNLCKHLALHHVFYISSICSAMYKTRTELQSHYMKRHCGFKRIQCCVCFEKFSSLVILKQHLILHCIQVLLPKNDRQRNKKLGKCVISEKIQCKVCGKRFRLKSRFKEHQRLCKKMGTRGKKLQKVPNPVETSLTERTLKDSNIELDHDLHNAKSSTVIQPKRLLKGIAVAKGYNVDLSDADKEKFFCITCNTRFQTFQKLCIHDQTYSKAATYVCESCNTAFSNMRLLRNHRRNTHAIDTLREFKYFCSFCTQGFMTKLSVHIHTKHFHAGQTPIIPIPCVDTTQDWLVCKVCSVCNLVFESSERFIQHNIFYYKGQSFTCSICSKTYQGMFMLHNHIKFEHTTEDMKKQYAFTCETCGEGFTMESQYHAHKYHVHMMLPVRSLQYLQEHTYMISAVNAITSDGSISKYSCDICNLSFMAAENLRQHKIEYTNDGDYLCPHCTRRCLTNDILKKHQSLSHSSSNPIDCYKCRHCKEVLPGSVELNSHEAHFHPMTSEIHRDCSNQAFVCTICGMKFESLEKLNYHSQEYSNESNYLYSCKICNHHFSELHNLEVHKLRHTNLNFILSKYHCPICREGFENQMNVWIHVMHFHQNAKIENPATNGVQNTQRCDQSAVMPNSVFNGQLRKKLTMCVDCLVTFDSERALSYHKARYVDRGNHVCEQCGRKFVFLKLLKQHLKKHGAGIGRLKYTCPGCDERFGNAVVRYQHIIHFHGRSMWKSKVLYPMIIQNDPESAAELLLHEKHDTSSPQVHTLTDTPPIASANSEPVDATNSTNSECSDSQEKSLSTIDSLAGASEQDAQSVNASTQDLYAFCPVCNQKCTSLNAFVMHLKCAHSQVIKKNIGNSSRTSPKHIDCLSDDTTFIKEGNMHLNESRPCNEDAAVHISEEDDDLVEVIWEKKRNAPKEIEEQDNDDEVHILCCSERIPIVNYDETVSMPEQVVKIT